MDKILYLVRHGVTQSNKEKIYVGWGEEKLVEEGVMQAEQVGEKMRGWGISGVYASPIKRAIQTAQILNRYVKKELKIEPGLKEIKMGAWEGLSEKEIIAKYPAEHALWLKKPAELKLEGRETLLDVQQRAVRAVNKILEENEGMISLVVTHMAPIRCLVLYYNHLSLNMYKSVEVPNLSIHQLKFNKGNIVIERMR